MKEYGVKDTWIKLYTIPYEENSCYTPLCISMRGVILLNYRRGLAIYNPTNGSFCYPKIGNFASTLSGFFGITYVESLVSPKIDNVVPSLQHQSKSTNANINTG